MRCKDPRYDLRLKYKKTLELALIISLLLVAGVFLASKEFDYVSTVKQVEQVVIKVEDIPIVRDFTPPPPPARPVIPFEDPNVPIEQDIEIPIDIPYVPDNLPPPPPIVEAKDIPFHRVEEKPVLIGGFQAILDYIRKNDLYPELARTAESSGEVVLLFTISETGEVTNLTIVAESIQQAFPIKKEHVRPFFHSALVPPFKSLFLKGIISLFLIASFK